MLAGLAGTAAGQEAGFGPALASSVETGWTSNAEQQAGGGGDGFVTHAHSLGFAGEGQGFALRGTIGIEATRYHRLWRENDWQALVTLDGQTALGAASLLRGSFSLAYEEQGGMLMGPVGPIGLVSPALSGSAGLGYETRVGATGIGLVLTYDGRRPGQTRVEGDVLAPTRTAAKTDTITARIDLRHALDSSAALVGSAQWQSVWVDPAETARYGRIPASLVSLAGGVEIGDGALTGLALRGGIDAIIADAEGIEPIFTPYAQALARLQFTERVGLSARLSAGADLDDPADGLADWRLEARGALHFSPLPGMGLEAALFSGHRRSAGLDIALETEWGTELVAQAALWDGLTLEGSVLHRKVSGLALPYRETRTALRIAAVF